MKSKTFVMLIVAIVLGAGVIGGAFFGGIALGKSQGQKMAQPILRNGFATAGQLPGSQSGTAQPTTIQGGFTGRGTMGTVQKIENGVITLQTQSGSSVLVTTSSSTTIQKMGTVDLSDIAVGESIQVTGETQTDGSVKATGIFVTPAGFNPGTLPAQPNQ